MAFFRKRRDCQIMSLELLAIAFGIGRPCLAVCFGHLSHCSKASQCSRRSSLARTSTCIRTILAPSTRQAKAGPGLSTTRAWCIAFGGCLRSRCRVFWAYLRGCRMRALVLRMALFVSRVPTHDNMSDDPSRERYVLLDRIGATRVRPFLHPHFTRPDAWESVSLVASAAAE